MNNSTVIVKLQGKEVVVSHFGHQFCYQNLWGALALAAKLHPKEIFVSFRNAGWRDDVTTA